MKSKSIHSGLMLIALICAIAVPARAQTANPQQTLNQYVAELQSNPSDTALRGKIIALAQTMNPPPETPAEARRHMARGVAAVEDAKTPDDFKDACKEFQQAATLAPWLANAYRNIAIAQDKAGMYDQSLASLRVYLLTRPSSADTDWADDLKSKVEYRKEKAAKAKEEENSPQAVVARQQQSFQDLLRKIDGRRYTFPSSNPPYNTQTIDVRGNFLVLGYLWPNGQYGDSGWPRAEINGYETTLRNGDSSIVYVISEDGESIAFHLRYPNNSNWSKYNQDRIAVWQR
jgi:hypothetical protein